jgi:phenylacetate-CoA ligase
MFTFRGVNIYPSNIDALISEMSGFGSEYQIHLSRDASERGMMKVVVERHQEGDASYDHQLEQELVQLVKKKLLVTPQVKTVPYGSLPRSERKSQRVFDERIRDSVI